MLLTVVLIALATMCELSANTSNGTDLLVKEADILKLNGTTYRLDGMDAPELDQVCLDEHGAVWRCGADARDRLTEHIGTRDVRCDDRGADAAYRVRFSPLSGSNTWICRRSNQKSSDWSSFA